MSKQNALESDKRSGVRIGAAYSPDDLPAYVYVGSGTVAKSVELIPGRVIADYAKNGILLGVEVIG